MIDIADHVTYIRWGILCALGHCWISVA